MSIASEISRLQQAKSDIKTAIEGKGVEVPSSAKIDTYDDYINAIVTGGGGDIPMPASATSVTLDDWARLTSVTIKSGVTSLPNRLYQFYYNLSSVTLPDTVTSIGNSAFNACSGLTSIDIPSGVTSIGDSVFSNCSSLTSITIPSGVTSIGYSAFLGCSSLTSITIPSGVTSIGDNAFTECSSLTSITIPSGVTSIGDWVFTSCSGLTSIDIPSGVTSIGSLAFYGCSGLTAITVNATTPPTIGNLAFDNTADAPIYVPCDSVDAYKAAWSNYASRITCTSPVPPTPPVGTYKAVLNVTGGQETGYITIACDASSALTSAETHVGLYTVFCIDATVGDCVTTIGDRAFNSYTALRTVTIPSGVTTIGYEAFLDCVVLSSITIPDSVTSIGQAAFEDCNAISSITIPSGVTSIGQSAFANSSGLTAVTCLATTPPTLGANAFEYSPLTAIYVPSASVNAYKSATNWSYYASLIQAIPPSSPFDFPFSINYNAKTYNSATNTIARTAGQLVDEDAVIIGDSSDISYSNGVLTFSPNPDWDGSQPTLVEFTGSTASYLDRSNQNSAMTIVAKIQTVDGTYTENCIDSDPDTGECWEYESNWCGYYMNFLEGGGYGFLLNPPTSQNECWDTDPDTGECIDEHIFANCLYLNGSVDFWANSNANGLATVSVQVGANGATYKDYGTLATGNTMFGYDSYRTSRRMFFTGENQCTTYKFAWIFMSQSALTAQQIQQVINYNENL